MSLPAANTGPSPSIDAAASPLLLTPAGTSVGCHAPAPHRHALAIRCPPPVGIHPTAVTLLAKTPARSAITALARMPSVGTRDQFPLSFAYIRGRPFRLPTNQTCCPMSALSRHL